MAEPAAEAFADRLYQSGQREGLAAVLAEEVGHPAFR